MVKYTEEVLREAVRVSVSMAAVLRHLGVPQNGGAHAHLRRRITALGIDTSHFLGRAHNRGRVSRRRLTPDQVLVLRPRDARRAAPAVLRRALVETGRPCVCAACGLDGRWNGRPLTLHVDHANGEFWDCRADNLRLLCPNCHSQTDTYAGRNRRKYAAPAGRPEVMPPSPSPLPDEAAVVRILGRVDDGELTVTAAARLIGCHRNHVYRIRQRLRESGAVRPARRRQPRTQLYREVVVAYALTHPELGPKSIARDLRHAVDRVPVAHGTVSTILRLDGLQTRAARRAAAATMNASTGGTP